MIRLSTNSFSWNTTYNKGVDELAPFDLCRQAADCGAEGIDPDRNRDFMSALELGQFLAEQGAAHFLLTTAVFQVKNQRVSMRLVRMFFHAQRRRFEVFVDAQ